jgi:hypothetical protein
MSIPRHRKNLRSLSRIAATPDTESTGSSLNPVDRLARAPHHDEIARRAYELFEERGREPGHEWEDWFRAEREHEEG